MDTPSTSHLSTQDFEHVYEPAEDSFLLLDALEKDLTLLKAKQPCVCLEIGSGSGLIITALAKQLTSSLCLAIDINDFACRATQSTAQQNGTQVECINSNLVDALRSQLVDVLIFNPPYVVTSDEELHNAKFNESQQQSNLVYSWAGGLDGRRIIDKLLLQLNDVLAPQGVFYLLLLRENKPDEVIRQLLDMQFEATKFMERRIPGEYLYILKIQRSFSKVA